MRTYQIGADNAIRGDQLIAEIQAAHGIDVDGHLSFSPPRTVNVASPFDEYDLSATVAAHSPTPPPRTKIHLREFAGRMTDVERAAIRNSSDGVVQKLREELMMATVADLEYPALIQGIQYLESIGLIGTGRASEILAP